MMSRGDFQKEVYDFYDVENEYEEHKFYENEEDSFLSTDYTCNFMNCSLIPPPEYSRLEGLRSVEFEMVNYHNKRLKHLHDENLKMCKRYHSRMEMFGKGTKKPVRLAIIEGSVDRDYFSSDQTDSLQQCSVPCQLVEQEEDSVDVFVFSSRNYYHLKSTDFSHHKQRLPFYADILNANIHPFVYRSQFLALRTIDIIIGHAPFSDIPLQRQMFEEYEETFKKANFLPQDFEKNFMKNFREKKKNALALDYVEHCPIDRDGMFYFRVKYLEYVQKAIKTDNYGKCGNNSQDLNEYSEYTSKNFGIDYIRANLALAASKYKFFFVFENAVSHNFFTEILWDALYGLYTIPIYLGAPNINDYFNSELINNYKVFIDAQNFPNPKDLVEYLQYLDRNDTAYFEYFQWRFDGVEMRSPDYLNFVDRVKNKNGENVSWMCRLCEKVYHGKKVCHQKKYPRKVSYATMVNYN